MFGRKSDWIWVAISVTIGVAVLANLLAGSEAVFAHPGGGDIHPECDAGGETPNLPALTCMIVPVVEDGKVVGEDCVGQTTPTSQACSGFVQKIIEAGKCVPGMNPPEVECQLYEKTIEQVAFLAQCEKTVDGDGKITKCECKVYDVGAKANTSYTECKEVATV